MLTGGPVVRYSPAMRHLAITFFAVLGAACGGDDSGADAPDAASSIDAGPSIRLDVLLDGQAICPDGWTNGPTAVDEEGANRITVTGSCGDGTERVILVYAPRPTGSGQTAPCAQSTMRLGDGSGINCRVNNEVLMDPEGQITLMGDSPAMVDGECGCMGDDGGTPRTGGADFLLTLD